MCEALEDHIVYSGAYCLFHFLEKLATSHGGGSLLIGDGCEEEGVFVARKHMREEKGTHARMNEGMVRRLWGFTPAMLHGALCVRLRGGKSSKMVAEKTEERKKRNPFYF